MKLLVGLFVVSCGCSNPSASNDSGKRCWFIPEGVQTKCYRYHGTSVYWADPNLTGCENGREYYLPRNLARECE